MEYITRQGKRLSQEWNVDSYEEDEKDRPEFIGRTIKVRILTVVLTMYTIELLLELLRFVAFTPLISHKL
jgi:hypothetical protein